MPYSMHTVHLRRLPPGGFPPLRYDQSTRSMRFVNGAAEAGHIQISLSLVSGAIWLRHPCAPYGG